MERHFATTFILDDRGKENDPSQGNNVPQVDGQGDTDTSSSDDADESWVPTSQKLTGARKRKSQQKVMVPRKPRCTEPKAEKEQEQDAAPEVIEIDVADLRHAPLVGGFSEDLFKTQDLAATPGLPCPSKGNDPVQKVEGATLRKTQDRSKIKGALKNQSNATFTHVSTGMEVNIEDEVDVIGDGYGDGNSQELFPTIHTSEESGTHEVGPKNIYEVTTDEAADTDFQNTQTSTCPPVSQPVKSGENTQSTSNTDVRPRRRLSRRRGVHSMNEKAEKLWRTIRGTVTFDPKKARPKTKHSMYSSDSSASPDRSVLAGVLPKRRPKNRPLVRPKEDVRTLNVANVVPK